MGRVRYNRASLESTVTAARKLAAATGKIRYVFATANGLTVWHEPPPGVQAYYRVTADGATSKVEPELNPETER